MNPQSAAEWFNQATAEEQEEFLKAIHGRNINGTSFWEVAARMKHGYSIEAAAREARTCIPESKVKHE